jgi:hypothetical protein
MLDLNSPLWQTFEGGYRQKYDASIILKQLEKENDTEKIDELLHELFQNLYHQHDVDVASYMALPHLIRIGIEKRLETMEIPFMVACIEAQRKDNPPIPHEFEKEYLQEIRQVADLLHINQSQLSDKDYAVVATSCLMAINGHSELSEIILEMVDDDIAQKFDMFLDKYDDFEEFIQNKT